MSARPVVSVLLVTYNHLEFIDRAIESLERQDFPDDWEIVVADDSSSDGTRERLLEWAERTALTVRVLPENARLGITLNYARGFAQCRGEFIAPLEGDDEWIRSDRIALMVDHLRRFPEHTMAANRVLLYDEASEASSVIPAIALREFESELTVRRLAEMNWLATFSACMYRSIHLDRVSAEVFETVAYDWLINMTVLGFGAGGFLPQVMTLYRQHGRGEWSRTSPFQRDLLIRDLLPGYIELAPQEARAELTRTLHILEGRLAGAADGADPGARSDEVATGIPAMDGPRPLISVVMAAYNHEAWIEESITSVLEQTVGDFELIVVDDASQDRTAAVVSRFNDPRIKVFRLRENQGGAAALNLGIQQARGDYVAVINSDDAWEHGKLERQLAEFAAHPECGAVFTGARYVGEDGRPLPPERIPPWHDVFRQRNRSQGRWLRFFFENGNVLCHPSILIRREIYTAIGLYDNRLRQIPDLLQWIRLVKHCPIRVIGDEDLVRFRLLAAEANASSTRRDNVVRGAREHLVVNETFFDGCPDDVLIDGFGDVMVDPEFATPEQRACEIALLWWNVVCPMTSFNRVQGLRELERLLGDDETALLLRARYDFRDANYHLLAGQETEGLPEEVRRWTMRFSSPGEWRDALGGVPFSVLARGVAERVRRAGPRVVVRRAARRIWPRG